jgi:peptide/nickel transport system permease protein
MLTFIVRRLLAAVGLLLLITLITFWIFYILPQWGGQSIQDLARTFVGKGVTTSQLQDVIHRYGFDKPFFVQYFDYVKAIVAGTQYSDGTELIRCNAPCFGYSFHNYEQVWPTILSDFPVTLSIGVGAGVLWLAFGVFSGVVSAVKKGSFLDRTFMFTALSGVSVPVYFIGPLLALVFAYDLNWLPVPAYTSITQSPASWAGGLLIPWFALAFGYAALYTRLTRAGMLDALGEDFTRTARAKGLSERKVVYKHALRAAITPIITIFGMDLGAVLGGAILAEKSLGLTGIGALAINAVSQKDFPMIMGVTLVAAFFVIIANLLVDIAYASLDPRVRLS